MMIRGTVLKENEKQGGESQRLAFDGTGKVLKQSI